MSFQPTLPLRGATSRLTTLDTRERCFNPRSPCGERLTLTSGSFFVYEFQPTLPLRGATPPSRWTGPETGVSTHAPLAGSDAHVVEAAREFRVSTHAPLAGSDPPCARQPRTASGFNPRSPCGERLPGAGREVARVDVSTHAPLAGSDVTKPSIAGFGMFQPTLPLRGATSDRWR